MTVIIGRYGEKIPFSEEKMLKYLNEALVKYPHLKSEDFKNKIIETIQAKDEYRKDQLDNLIILNSLERISVEEPDWTFIASYYYLKQLYKQASINRGYKKEEKYGGLYPLIKKLVAKGIYNPVLLEDYSLDEIAELGLVIDPSKDLLFTYIGLKTLADRYLATDKDKNIFELPQERFMIIAMYLMKDEVEAKRMDLIKEAYWALSNLYMTVATPTLSNAGKNAVPQLSSCFIDTVEDSLEGIYHSNTDVARVSKAGGGIGVYLGKIRSRGSDIKGFKGVSSGVIAWMKQLNTTAVNVDQLGVRKGAIAVYYPVWGKDILAFLDAKLNNGDERFRTHDLFTGVCVPDIFMEKVQARENWYLFDPHEVKQKMGFELDDFYDEELGQGAFREKYEECVNNPELSRETIPAIEIMKRIMKSQLETGTPYMFYSDTVNRANANKHQGIIYCSNLCTEITQNMSPTTVVEEYTTDDGKVVTVRQSGDFVVCNLSSISLERAQNVLERLIPIQVRMLDNVIDLNVLEVGQAKYTNQKYRAIGLGTFGWAHYLANKGIQWESSRAVAEAEFLYTQIAYLTIKASMELAKEKGAYPLFEGSDWHNGDYFENRGLNGERWIKLREDVQEYGIRNGYLMAVAPNGSTAIIGGSSAGIDPIFSKFYSEEK
jgi:ribonucleoside-diphosphate reductase alpha chain